MRQYLWIGLGGFIGANTRYLLQQCAANRWGADFPYRNGGFRKSEDVNESYR